MNLGWSAGRRADAKTAIAYMVPMIQVMNTMPNAIAFMSAILAMRDVCGKIGIVHSIMSAPMPRGKATSSRARKNTSLDIQLLSTRQSQRRLTLTNSLYLLKPAFQPCATLMWPCSPVHARLVVTAIVER